MTYNKPHLELYNWQPAISPIDTRILMLSAGLNVITPDFIMPQFNFEPFTLDELKDICGYKRANISKLRSIIRNQKRKHEY